MIWFRVDNRLVHGQVIEAWLPYLDADHLVVVNDALAANPMQQQIMRLAIPARISVGFIALRQARNVYDELAAGNESALFLVAGCEDIARMVEQGIRVSVLNVGNMHYGEGKQQVCAHVALSPEDKRCLGSLRQNGTHLDYRCVPTDMPDVKDW